LIPHRHLARGQSSFAVSRPTAAVKYLRLFFSANIAQKMYGEISKMDANFPNLFDLFAQILHRLNR